MTDVERYPAHNPTNPANILPAVGTHVTETHKERLSRRARRRLRTQAHTPVATPVPVTPTIETTAPLNTYDSDQRWAIDYANNNIQLFDKRLVVDASGNQHIETIPVSPATAELIAAREHLAETSVALRNSGAYSKSSRREAQLANAEATYDNARANAASELLASLPAGTSLEQKQALLAEFAAREDGALMGEESNYYMDRSGTFYQRSLEKYRGFSRKQKIAAVLGVTAATATLGFIAGGALAGGIIGARFGKSYFKSEADRGTATTVVDRQRLATLRGSSHDDLIARGTHLRGVQDETQLASTYGTIASERTRGYHDTYLAESRAESEAKRRSMRNAIAGVAIGGAAGWVLENLTDWHGVLRGSRIDLWLFNNINIDNDLIPGIDADVSPDVNPGDVDLGAATEAEFNDSNQDLREEIEDKLAAAEEELAQVEAEKDALQEQVLAEQQRNAELTEQLRAAQEAAAAEAAAQAEAVSAAAQALYGEFAGSTVSIDIPAGSNIWDQLELKIDQQNPYITFEEKQRLVGNMLEALQEQHPGRDLNLVYPGEHFALALAA